MKIFGQVLDGNSGEPLVGVTLKTTPIEGAKPVANVITKRDGSFELEDPNLMDDNKVEFILNGYVDVAFPANELTQGNPIYLYEVTAVEGQPLEGELEIPKTTPLKTDLKSNSKIPLLVIAASAALLFYMFRKKK